MTPSQPSPNKVQSPSTNPIPRDRKVEMQREGLRNGPSLKLYLQDYESVHGPLPAVITKPTTDRPPIPISHNSCDPTSSSRSTKGDSSQQTSKQNKCREQRLRIFFANRAFLFLRRVVRRFPPPSQATQSVQEYYRLRVRLDHHPIRPSKLVLLAPYRLDPRQGTSDGIRSTDNHWRDRRQWDLPTAEE